jgi:hypothetical protein
MKMKTTLPLLAAGICLECVAGAIGQTTFTKITTGAIVTELGFSAGCLWGDYNNDGYLDLFVANQQGVENFLYLNNGDGTFTNISTGDIVTDGGNSTGCSWGDFDNDGNLDLLVTNGGRFSPLPNFLYKNNGDGTFTKITSGNVVTDLKVSFAGTWGDYDNDGYIDLLVSDNEENKNALYRNNGDSTFTPIMNVSLVNEAGTFIPTAWADYNNDGFIDAFVGATGGNNNLLYRNKGDGTFVKVTSGGIVNSLSVGCAWGDYDNDGLPDLFITSAGIGSPQKNSLYHNKGNGTFANVTSGSIVNDIGNFVGCAWGDYDNDGFLDLFVCRQLGQNNVLYHNNGDGTFTRITEGSLVNDGGNSVSCSWGDYDNDGFPDLFVTNGAFGDVAQKNFLYRNNGNSNNWIKIKLVGTVSNRAAIGAKVRAKATIAGKSVVQVREISSGSGHTGQNPLAHFGLGNATNVDLLRIEWPSGITQEFHDVGATQALTLTEPPLLRAQNTEGVSVFSLKGGRGLYYSIERSEDLRAWSVVSSLTVTNLDGTVAITDRILPTSARRFYRAMQLAQ